MFDENDKVKSDCNSKKSLDNNYRQGTIQILLINISSKITSFIYLNYLFYTNMNISILSCR